MALAQSAPASSAASTSASASGKRGTPVRVLVVDDSAVIRGLVKRWLDEAEGIEVAGSASNGQLAVAEAGKIDPDVVILDIEMPVMDGLTALPGILKASPGVKIIMASTLTLRNAEISLKALSLGATDYVPKPDSARGIAGSDEFRRELLDKVLALGTVRQAQAGRPRTRAASVVQAAPRAVPAAPAAKAPIVLRQPSSVPPRILAVGSSTGGPQALFALFEEIGPKLKRLPVVIAQHMPASFTRIMAEKLGKVSGLVACEGADGQRLEAGHLYVAPGDHHMRVARDGTGAKITLDQSPPVHFCRPSVDPLFESVAGVYGPSVLAVVLTGMGHDGRDGGRMIADQGGTVLAQDEETSVVWGMPGACAQAGICAGVYPLPRMGGEIGRIIGGARA